MLNIPALSQQNWIKLIGTKGTLKRAILVSTLSAGLIPLLLISFIALWLTNNMASNLVYQNLMALKANKIVAIEAYGKQIADQIVTSSNDPNLAVNMMIVDSSYREIFSEIVNESANIEALVSSKRDELNTYYTQSFLPQYKSLNNGKNPGVSAMLNSLSDHAVVLQHAYIQDNTAPIGNKDEMASSDLDVSYDNAHEILHKTYRDFLNRFGYYDIFLVNNEGDVVYSVFKELDYATNLYSGPYAQSGLADAFKQSTSINADDYVLIDYAQYTPSYEAPASFIASPIFHQGKRLGALIFQMPLDAINAVMSERSGLGSTGESYLVGPDKKLRSDTHKYANQYSVDSSFRHKKTIDSTPITQGLSGQSGITRSLNYTNEEVLSAYSTINFASLQWAIIAELETKEAFASVAQLRWIVAIICILAILSLVFVAIRVTTRIINPVHKMRKAMSEVAAQSDFSKRVEVTANDEIGNSIDSFNTLLESVESSLKETNTVVSAMSHGDFSQRIVSDFKGDLHVLKLGVNDSAQAIENSIKEVIAAVESLAQGKTDQKIEMTLDGDLSKLKKGVNDSVDAIASSIASITHLMTALQSGNFKYKAKDKLPGEFGKIMAQADVATDAIDTALVEVEEVMYKVSIGKLDARINSELPGQLAGIKANINTSITSIQQVFAETQSALTQLSKGQLYSTISADFPGGYNDLKLSTNTTITKLTEVVSEIQQTSRLVKASSTEITSGNTELSSRTEQQAVELDRTASSMDEITSTVRHTADNAGHAKTIAEDAKKGAQRGGEIVNDAVQAMQEINQASEKIADIIGVIDAIAFQTNLLALNAAVEAARAGEQGKGFAVVASEVRNLAGRSANAAKQIKSLINDSVSKVKVGSQLVSDSGRTLTDIINQVQNVSDIVSEISIDTDKQTSGAEQVQRAVEAIQSVTQQNTAMVEHAAATSEQLNEQAESMNELMAFFATKAND